MSQVSHINNNINNMLPFGGGIYNNGASTSSHSLSPILNTTNNSRHNNNTNYSTPTSALENQYLVAVHDFNGRTEDEINLRKGDHILVLEDDSEFGDGWYIGRNLSTAKAGLFPFVFTTKLVLPTPAPLNSNLVSPLVAEGNGYPHQQNQKFSSTSSLNIQHDGSATAPGPAKKSSFSKPGYVPNESVHDTLTDIDEAISELNNTNSPYNNNGDTFPSTPTTSSSSNSLPHFNFSYTSIFSWTPQMVQEYFLSRGYEESVCACFLRHKITGSILLELDLGYLKEIDIASFGTRFEISKEIKMLNQKVNDSTPSNTRPHSNTSNVSKTSSLIQTPTSQIMRTPFSSSQPNILMSPPAFNRQSLLRTSSTDLSPASQHSPQTPVSSRNSRRETNSHRKDSSFDPNWVLPEKPAEPPIYEATFETPTTQVRGRVRSSTISTTDQYFHDNQSSPDTPSLPKYAPFQPQASVPINRPSSPNSAGGHSRKSSYVEDTRARHKTHSRQSSFDTVKGHDTQDNSSNAETSHSRSASSVSMGFSDFKFLKPFTNGTFPDAFLEDDEAPEVQLTQQEKRASGAPLSLLKPFQIDTSKLRSKKEMGSNEDLHSQKRVQTDPTMEKSIDLLESPKTPVTKRPLLRSASSQNNLRSKTFSSSKKKTSAFQEGINTVSPEESAKTADFSGWMSKRGSVAVGTWKSRFFTLHGTRLSYFASKSDSREKGLIDITSHRVVPVGDDDKFVALYAASVGAGRYCFKVLPPQAGTAKGVTFTIPKVHYFAVETREELRDWIKALKKATIDRDDTVPVISSCATPTIPLTKARELMADARVKADTLRLQAIAAANPGGGNNASSSEKAGIGGSWLNEIGPDLSTPDSISNLPSLTSSESESSSTLMSSTKAGKLASPTDYFSSRRVPDSVSNISTSAASPELNKIIANTAGLKLANENDS
jgi:hypothetical protein